MRVALLILLVTLVLGAEAACRLLSRVRKSEPHCDKTSPLDPPQYTSSTYWDFNITLPLTKFFCGEIDEDGQAYGFNVRPLEQDPSSAVAKGLIPYHEQMFGFQAFRNICIWNEKEGQCAEKVATLADYTPSYTHPNPRYNKGPYFGFFPKYWTIQETVKVLSIHVALCCARNQVYQSGVVGSCENLTQMCILNFSDALRGIDKPFAIKIFFKQEVTDLNIEIDNAFPVVNEGYLCSDMPVCNADKLLQELTYAYLFP